MGRLFVIAFVAWSVAVIILVIASYLKRKSEALRQSRRQVQETQPTQSVMRTSQPVRLPDDHIWRQSQIIVTRSIESSPRPRTPPPPPPKLKKEPQVPSSDRFDDL